MLAYEFGPMHLDVDQHALTCDGETVSLPPRLFQILLILVENEGRLVSQEAMRNRVWPDSFVGIRRRPVLRWGLAVIALLALVLLAVGRWRSQGRAPAPAPLDGLAVIPSHNLSTTADSGWIGIALEETLSRGLSRDPGLQTVSLDQVAIAEEDLGLEHARSRR